MKIRFVETEDSMEQQESFVTMGTSTQGMGAVLLAQLKRNMNALLLTLHSQYVSSFAEMENLKPLTRKYAMMTTMPMGTVAPQHAKLSNSILARVLPMLFLSALFSVEITSSNLQ